MLQVSWKPATTYAKYFFISRKGVGMPRKKAAEIEVLPPEDNQPSQKVIKHKTEWVEVVEEAPEEGEAFDDDVVEVKPRRKVNSEREELRKKLAKSNITPGSQLKLTIEKYLHSDAVDSRGGMFAETEHCTKYVCAESHITSEDYLDVARKFGAGLYRFTLRMKNQIVTAWDKRISGGMAGTVIQQTNPADPNSPQVIVQTTNGDGQTQQIPMSIKDIMKTQREALKEQLEMAKLMREAYGFAPEQSQQQQQQTTDPELAALQLITKNPDVMEKIADGIAKSIFGGKGVVDDTPWWADILKDSITTGQLAPTVQGVVKALFPNGLFGGLFPGGQNNGQTPIHQAPLQNQQNNQAPVSEGVPQIGEGMVSGTVESSQGASVGQDQTTTVTPEQHALTRLIQNCQRNVPVQVAFQQLVNYADWVNEQAPDYSIDGYIDLLGSMETEQVIEFVKSLPGGEQIIVLPHAKEWCAELQRLIKESQEGEE
jgi:hypothetical protein